MCSLLNKFEFSMNTKDLSEDIIRGKAGCTCSLLKIMSSRNVEIAELPTIAADLVFQTSEEYFSLLQLT